MKIAAEFLDHHRMRRSDSTRNLNKTL
jgi:hypothetical protein